MSRWRRFTESGWARTGVAGGVAISMFIVGGIIASSGSGGCAGTVVADGADLKAAMDAGGAGTTYCISGTHTLTTAVLVQTGDKMIGLSGSSVVGGDSVLAGNATLAVDGNNANNVTIKGLLFRYFNNASQIPAVGKNNAGSGWDVNHNEVANNATEGIFVGAGASVTYNHVHDNGQLGISAYLANGATISNNEIDHNGASAYTLSEGGGFKAYNGPNITGYSLTVSNNNVHDNVGTGIWLDTNLTASTVSGNTITNNGDSGGNSNNAIEIELSCNTTVSNNTIVGPGDDTETRGIMLSASDHVTVTGNTISGTKHGIINWDDVSRGSEVGTGSCLDTVNSNTITGNTLTTSAGSSHQTIGDTEWNGGAIACTTNGTTTVTVSGGLAAKLVAADVGMAVVSGGSATIPAGTTVTAVTPGVSFTLSSASGVNSGTGTCSFGKEPTAFTVNTNTYHLSDCNVGHWPYFITGGNNYTFSAWKALSFGPDAASTCAA